MSTADTLLSNLPQTPSAGIRLLAKLGFAAVGVVYGLMGVLALLAALGPRLGGAHTDKSEAVRHLQDLPGGPVLLGLIAVGLLAYIAWRLAQAVLDTEDQGTGWQGLAKRLRYLGSGLVYASLALYAARLALHGRATSDGSMKRTLISTVLEWPGGKWLVLLAGLVVVGVGLYQIYRVFAGEFHKRVYNSNLPKNQQDVVYRAGQVGYTARGIVLGLIGYFLMQAGWQSRAGAMGSTDEAFDLLATMGPVVLGTVAAGLVAYGLFMLVQARYPLLRSS